MTFAYAYPAGFCGTAASAGEPKTKTEQTAGAICALIRGHLKAGDRLPSEPELCELMKAGRGTVREAVKILTSRSVLTIKRGIGTFIKAIPESEGGAPDFASNEDPLKLASDSCELRALIEPKLAHDAALSRSDHMLDVLSKNQDEFERAINAGRDHSQLDMQFHALIADCSSNVLMRTITPLIERSIPFIIRSADRELYVQARDIHREIFEAILSQDAEAARDAMQRHMLLNRQYIDKAAAAREFQESLCNEKKSA
ncbi:MAG: FCD domain-containing protein [Succinivibrio sp.]|jgi:GntR family transcriptional repressor for pyruvate dehydrogenase complex|nr:FCD domain-containing protein [Succinivibrio sp.]